MAATAPSPSPPSVIGQALVDFSVEGLFPEDDVSKTTLDPEKLPAAIQMLAEAKTKLENEIHDIVEETADDVRSWIANAKALQADIARRKTLATDILIRADDVAPSETSDSGHHTGSGQSTDEAEAEARARFLTGELNYNLQVRYLLEAIRAVNQLLDRVEAAACERRILDALRLLEKSWTALDAMPVSKSCRAMRLLDIRAFELKSDVHEVFDRVWGALVHVDTEKGTLTVVESREDEPMNLSDAVIGLKAYKEVDNRMAELWHALDRAIVSPRTDLSRPTRPAIYVDDSILGIKGDAPDGVEALFADLEQMFAFLAAKLPSDLVQSISSVMMPELVSRVIDVWLGQAVPTSLAEMGAFEGVIMAAQRFCARLKDLHYSGFGRLQEWIENAPRVWLSKRREVALDAVRTKIAQGLGTPQQVEKVEKQMVSRSEVKELAASGPAATDQAADWDTAWSDEEEEKPEEKTKPTKAPSKPANAPIQQEQTAEDDGADAWAAWGEDDEPPEETTAAEGIKDDQPEEKTQPEPVSGAPPDDTEDDAAEAWGWGDEDAKDEEDEATTAQQPATAASQPAQPTKKEPAAASAAATGAETPTRELTLREKYYISSMPEPVLSLVAALLEDAAALTSAGGQYESSPVAAAAAGLFGVPSLALAMFRAVSPYYYALDHVGGSMFLYNDATYLAEKLADLAAAWRARTDVSESAKSLLRLDAEIAKLQRFASRAYGREMAVQKTVLRDLLGGDQNVLASQQGRTSFDGHDDGASDQEADDCVDAAVLRVRSMAAAWQDVLAPSAWYQAVGSLADAVAAKLVADVLDMPSISQDEAFSLANLIAKVTELDDLFLPEEEEGETKKESSSNKQGGGETTPPLPMTAQYAPGWLRLQYLSEVLQSNLREVRYLWMESELSLYFSADEVVDLIRLSFEDNARAREVMREIAAHPHPVEA